MVEENAAPICRREIGSPENTHANYMSKTRLPEMPSELCRSKFGKLKMLSQTAVAISAD